MQKRTRPLQTNAEQQTVSSASKKSRKNPSNFFAIPEDVQRHRIAVFLDNKTLAAYAVTHKAALQHVVPELKRRLPSLAVKLIIGGTYATHIFLLNDKELYAYFTYDGQQTENIEHFTQVAGITGNVQQVVTSQDHTFILTDKGLYAWGNNQFGQLGLGDTQYIEYFTQVTGIIGTVQQMAVGFYCSLILTDKGLYACGYNESGQLGLGDTQNRQHFTQVTGITGTVQQVVAGEAEYTFILSDKGLYACGHNGFGQLGLGDNQNRQHFTQVTGITGIVQQVVAGGQHSFILTDTGLYACGANSSGQLGLGDTQNRRHFTQVTGITGTVQQVVAGGQHSFILTDKGLYACGSNMCGQLGLGDNQDRAHFTQVTGMTGTVQQIGAGGYNSFIFTDKGLYGCGINNGNQLGHEGHLTTFQPIPAIIPKAIKDNGKHYQPFTRLIKASETLTFFSQTPSSNTIAQTRVTLEQSAHENLTPALAKQN